MNKVAFTYSIEGSAVLIAIPVRFLTQTLSGSLRVTISREIVSDGSSGLLMKSVHTSIYLWLKYSHPNYPTNPTVGLGGMVVFEPKVYGYMD